MSSFVANPSYGLVLLAAGGSTRMGRPKQLLEIGEKTLLRHVAEIALAAPVSPVVIVLGANAAEIKPFLAGLAAHVVVNENWRDGMASSLRVGIETLTSLAPKIGGAILVLGDQPDLSVAHLFKLIEVHQRAGRSIVATQIGGTLMPPALFAARYFPELISLRGDAGARTLFQAHAAEVAAVPAEALPDLDTPEDYQAYLRGS
ncbi:MAG TPA: nucleotidyltransferase family protein [Candidatus Didemnitutus sp.]|nr:nucleotidyltransferase family protein [Candidatus Didemnitutus sp.]